MTVPPVLLSLFKTTLQSVVRLCLSSIIIIVNHYHPHDCHDLKDVFCSTPDDPFLDDIPDDDAPAPTDDDETPSRDDLDCSCSLFL